MTWIGGLLDRIFAAAGALLFAQLPMFMLQYTQQLAGRAAELNRQISSLKQISMMNGKSLNEYIHKFIATGDPDFVQQGELMQKMIQRFSYLSQAENDMSEASPLTQLFVFLRHFDSDIAKMTFTYFKFGIPLSVEGLIYGLIGLGFGCMLFHLLARSVNALKRALVHFGNKVHAGTT